jgi:hypothetical protein
MPTLFKGQELDKNDLFIYVKDSDGNFFSPFSITYTIYQKAAQFSGQQCITVEPIKETIDSPPIPFGLGKFFAAWEMSKDTTIGNYIIKWNIAQYYDSPLVQYSQEFQIVTQNNLSADASAEADISKQFPGAYAV